MIALSAKSALRVQTLHAGNCTDEPHRVTLANIALHPAWRFAGVSALFHAHQVPIYAKYARDTTKHVKKSSQLFTIEPQVRVEMNGMSDASAHEYSSRPS